MSVVWIRLFVGFVDKIIEYFQSCPSEGLCRTTVLWSKPVVKCMLADSIYKLTLVTVALH